MQHRRLLPHLRGRFSFSVNLEKCVFLKIISREQCSNTFYMLKQLYLFCLHTQDIHICVLQQMYSVQKI